MLDQTDVFRGLDEQEKYRLAAQTKIQIYGKGETIFNENAGSKELFIIIDGEVSFAKIQPIKKSKAFEPTFRFRGGSKTNNPSSSMKARTKHLGNLFRGQ